MQKTAGNETIRETADPQKILYSTLPDLEFHAAPGANAALSDFTADTSSVVLAANPSRKLLTVFNDGPATLYLRFGTGTASATAYTVKLSANHYFETEKFSGNVNGIFSASGSTARVTEVTG